MSSSDTGVRVGSGISLGEAMGVATTALSSNKMRSALTMLGIIIGVAAVITMVALGTGAQRAVTDRITSLGANLLFVRPGASMMGHVRLAAGAVESLDQDDADALAKECPSITAVVPEASGSYQVKYENKNWNTRVTGTTADFEWVRNSPVANGEFFTVSDDARRQRVCVIGKIVADNLFGEDDPIGRTIKIRGINFAVKGVLQEKGSQGWFNPDDMILVPLQTALYRVLGRDTYGSVTLRVADESLMDLATVEVENVLRRRHNLAEGQENDFSVRSNNDVSATLGETTQTFTALLASVALVSLLVGGIGIMNIMLVSVTERTREIGVRMALGARRRDILTQFLIESTSLAVIGGIVGIALGIGLTVALARFYGWNTLVSPQSVLLSFGFSAVVGIFFGMYPARKAALLDPIDALRYE
ncbi:MAG TPA: ABC transporter permease [candidate division Zixibacteria bacterium]|jgi:ABC-type antimicrobial peptide transport system permease subunit